MRCTKLTSLSTLLALATAVPLMLGAALQEARAGACKKAGLGISCVRSPDLKKDSLRAADIENESQAVGAVANTFLDIPEKEKALVKVSFTPPTDGWVVLTGSGTLGISDRTSTELQQVACQFRIGRRFSTSKGLSQFLGSVSGHDKTNDSMFGTGGFAVAGGKTRKFFLACRQFQGSGTVSMILPAITAVFHPVRYKPKR